MIKEEFQGEVHCYSVTDGSKGGRVPSVPGRSAPTQDCSVAPTAGATEWDQTTTECGFKFSSPDF